MSDIFVEKICTNCQRPYTYWNEKGFSNHKKYCPDCVIVKNSEAVHGLPLENIAGRERPLDKIWADKQTVRLLIKLAGLTVKQKTAVKKFMTTGKVPEKETVGSFYQAIRKIKRAGKVLFK